MNFASAAGGRASSVAVATAATSAILIADEEHQQRELLQRPRRERAARREHADVARHFAAAEAIEQGSAIAGFHDRYAREVGADYLRGRALLFLPLLPPAFCRRSHSVRICASPSM